MEVINESLSLAEAHATDSNLCVDEPTCRKYGQQKEIWLIISCLILRPCGRLRFTVFGLLSKDSSISQENYDSSLKWPFLRCDKTCGLSFMWQASLFYFTFPTFMSLGFACRTSRQSKGANQDISYLIKIVKRVGRSRMLEIAT